MTTVALGLHGVGVEVRLPAALAERLLFDFGMFHPSNLAGCRLQLHLGDPPPLPVGLDERFRGPHFVVFERDGQRYVVYPQTGWLSWDARRAELHLYAADPDRGYLQLMLCIQSRLGELLERQGLQRIHGLGLAGYGQGALLLLPPRGGKSTLAWETLRHSQELTLFSEDTPLLDGRGQLHSFPFRLGLRQPVDDLPCRRQDHKWHVDATLFRDRWMGQPAPCRHLILGAWTTNSRPRLERLWPAQAVPALLRDGLLGYGVPQLIELHWPLSTRDRLTKLGVTATRLGTCLGLLRRCRVWRMWMCPQPGANLAQVQALLAGHYS